MFFLPKNTLHGAADGSIGIRSDRDSFSRLVYAFRLPILGVILLFEALGLMTFIKNVAADEKTLTVALLLAIISAGLPGGFLIGTMLGTIVMYFWSGHAFRKNNKNRQQVEEEDVVLSYCGDIS